VALDTGENLASTVLETNRSIWLAGLGALTSLGRTATSTAGLQSFEALVKAGEALEQRSRALLDNSTEAAQKSVKSLATKVDEKLEQFESVFDRRIAGSLARLQVPTNAELAILLSRIEQLELALAELREQRCTPKDDVEG
jgi:poly(hydroxyalkanoate) granule-associated protein